MKFNKYAYLKVWQDCPEDEREDTTIRLEGYEDANELNSIPVALLYLLERNAFIAGMEEFDIIERCLTAETFDLIGFVQTYRDMLSKRGDFWTPMKFITASPKPVDGMPPLSYCPRCGAIIWPDTERRVINKELETDTEYYRRIYEIYNQTGNPAFCHNCGQRFKFIGQDNLAYKHYTDRRRILTTLKLRAEQQPTLDLAEITQ